MKKNIEASKLFLESERESVTRPAQSQVPSTSTSTAQELIKCFCGICETWFNRKSIEYALKSNGYEILNDEASRNILRKFSEYNKGNSPFRTILEDILDCFELAQAILNGEKDLEENRAELDDLCYTSYWEDYLVRAIEDGITDDFFHDIMRDSGTRLENSDEYPLFKEELKKKLRIQ